MKDSSVMYLDLCSYDNLKIAFKKARKGKTTKGYVLEFEQNIPENLLQLQTELLFHTYKPKPLRTFILRDPKTRKISKSAFCDRIIHHALCNIIEPLFEKDFIFDSYANRKNKGVLKAIERFEQFQRCVSRNHSRRAFVLKADIKKYFDNVNHTLLLNILQEKINDSKLLWLIKTILTNYKTETGKGMPLGNLTSQFFANVFLNELDHFVKHKLHAKYYIRYVDDFVILHQSPRILHKYMKEIDIFLRETLALQLHPDKSRIIPISGGVEFLGARIFPHHKLLKEKNVRKLHSKLASFYEDYEKGIVNYDAIYDFLEGWNAHAKNTNTHHLRRKVIKAVEKRFPGEISTKEINRSWKKNKL